MSKVKLSEWFWRFMAMVMLFSVGWTMWIFYQLNAPPLIMNAAFEAAAKAKANAGQSTQGVIVPSGGAAAAPKAPETPAAAPLVPEVPKEPPINPEKLKFSDSIALPDPNTKK